MNQSKYKAGLDGLRTSKDFNERTLALLKHQSDEGNRHKGANRMVMKLNKKVLGAALASAAVLAVILFSPLLKDSSKIALDHSSDGVTVRYEDNAPIVSTHNNLVPLTEEEIFKQPKMSIFKGTVKEIQNIKIELGKGAPYYQAIATIQVEEVYQGKANSGNTVKVHIPAPIGTGERVSDTEVVSAIRIDTTGIFMPIQYDGTEKREENGETLVLKDMSDYGFYDGERFAFLQSEQGLIFSKDAYPSLSQAQTLNDVKQYVTQMISAVK